LVANGYFVNAITRTNQDSFNFYYDMDGGWRTATPYNPDDPNGGSYMIGAGGLFGVDFHFANTQGSGLPGDVQVLVMKDLARFKLDPSIGNTGHVLLLGDDGLASSRLPVNQVGSCVINSEADYSGLLHESGHAIFGLQDEYACSNATTDRFDSSGVAHPNVFNGETMCRDPQLGSSHPADCKIISGCSRSWKADADPSGGSGCCMGDTGNMLPKDASIQYDADCRRRANDILAQTWK
jgi:hypothetical protein